MMQPRSGRRREGGAVGQPLRHVRGEDEPVGMMIGLHHRR